MARLTNVLHIESKEDNQYMKELEGIKCSNREREIQNKQYEYVR